MVAIVAGIIVGPSVLDWVRIDSPITVLSLLGLAFLLFLAGLELDLDRLRGPLLGLAGTGFLISVAIGVIAGWVFHAVGYVQSPFLLAVTLSATSLGLVVPILKDAGQLEKDLGQLAVAGSSVAEFGATLLLSFFFSESSSNSGTKIVLIAGLAVLVVVIALALSRLNMSMRLDAVLTRLQDTTAEIRAGGILAAADKRSMSHPYFRAKLEAIGYGFLVPVFFVASGIRLDLQALTQSPSAFARVPLFLIALLLVRGLPAALYRRRVGDRGSVTAGLLQATTLPVVVTAVQIGQSAGKVSAATGAALIFAGLLSVVIFPVSALRLLGRQRSPAPGDEAVDSMAQGRPG